MFCLSYMDTLKHTWSERTCGEVIVAPYVSSQPMLLGRVSTFYSSFLYYLLRAFLLIESVFVFGFPVRPPVSFSSIPCYWTLFPFSSISNSMGRIPENWKSCTILYGMPPHIAKPSTAEFVPHQASKHPMGR